MDKSNVAVIIGGTGHIGTAIVVELRKLGCNVAVVARHEHSLEEFPENTFDDGARISIHQADASVEDQIKRCLNEVKEDFGRIDYVVYSAGITPEDVPLAEYSTESWERTFDVYVKGFFLCFREGMRTIERGGHMVAISSAITRFPTDMLPKIHAGQYAAAKAALDEFVRWGRREAHDNGLLLSRVAPGAVDTPFHQNARASRRPAAVLPLDLIANKVTEALRTAHEIDLQIVAQPKQGALSAIAAVIDAN